MRTPRGAWVVVADGGKFLILENQGDAERIDLRVRELKVHENPPTHEQGADRPGRMPDGPMSRGPRSALESTDWHALEEERFASELAGKLKAWALAGEFRELILIADPKTLGLLRPELHQEVVKALRAEIPKDLTNHPLDKIEAALAAA